MKNEAKLKIFIVSSAIIFDSQACLLLGIVNGTLPFNDAGRAYRLKSHMY